ncbi:MAG: hypothetical protein Q7S19_00160 [bacterium]|nr:hypothetical protein [bacterium]
MTKTKKTFEVQLEVVPTSGKPITKTVTIEASATLAEVLKEAGVSLDKKNLSVDGKPATPETRVTSASKIVAVHERPQGS